MPPCCENVPVCFLQNSDSLWSVGKTNFTDFWGNIELECDNHKGTKTYKQKVHLLDEDQKCEAVDIDGISSGSAEIIIMAILILIIVLLLMYIFKLKRSKRPQNNMLCQCQN